MCTLPEYGVPKEILQIEQSKKLLGGTTPKEIAEQLGQSSMLDKSTERGYANAFRRMLQFEEAAQSQYVIQFNTKDIQLKRSDSGSEREFCIKNDVRTMMAQMMFFFFTILTRFSPSLFTHKNCCQTGKGCCTI